MKKIVGIVVILLMILSMVFPSKMKVEAATKTYISEIFFSSDRDNKGDCVKDLVAKGVPENNVIDHDFNCNVKGKYIYIGYKTTTNASAAIRGLVFSGEKADSISYNGITYKTISNASNPLNSGALSFNQGVGGSAIYLYYSKDTRLGPPITDLGAWCSRNSGLKGCNDTKVRNINGRVQDCNDGLRGTAYIYLTYKCDEVNKSTNKTNYKIYEDPNNIPIGQVMYKKWLESNNILRDWVDVANVINTKNLEEDFGGDSYRMQVGSLININNPRMAAAAITSNSNIQNAFSNTDQPTFYLKGNNAGLIFTNFQFVDDAKFFFAAADDVKVGDSLRSLEEKGIQISQGTINSQEVDTMENRTAQSANLDSSYRNSKSISNTLAVSNTNASEFRTDTSITIGTSVEYKVPFGNINASLSVEETLGYTTSASKTRSTENTDTEEKESSSTVSVVIPAHTKCSILKQISTGEVIQSYNSACILTYDVYYIKDSKYYHFTGISDGHSKYGNAAENLYHRAVTFPSLGISDTKQDSSQTLEGTIDWKEVMTYYPTAKAAIYDLYRKVPITPYGGTLTSTVKQTTYKAGAYEPLYKLANLKPSVTNILMNVEETYDFEKVSVKATDEFNIPWYGFYEESSGKWEVVSGPAKVAKNSAGNWELTATGTGKAVIRYNPSNIAASKISKNLDNRGITVNITKKDGEIQSVKPSKTTLTINSTDSETKVKEQLAKLTITGACPNKKTVKLTNTKSAWKISKEKAVATFNAPKGYIFKNGKDSVTVTVNLTTTLSKSDQKLATYQPLLAKATKATKTSITLNWSKVAGATGYTIYNSKFVKVKDTKSTSYTVTKLKKGTFYNYTVVAYKSTKGKNTTLAVSTKIYQTTTGGSYGNAKSVKVDKSSVSLKKGKSYTLKSSEVKKDKKLKKYRALSYETSNKKIAAVSSKGKITAKKKGSCNIYVYAQNGISAKVKVTVK